MQTSSLPEYMSFSGVRVAQSLVFSVVFCRLSVLFLLGIVMSVLLGFTDSDIFKLLFDEKGLVFHGRRLP